MGIIKAAVQSVSSGLADQWLEVIECGDMGGSTVFTTGVKIDRKNSNTKSTDNTVSNGSIIHVATNQFMILTDGGKIIDYSAEEGYYEVRDSSMPSLFNGQFKDTLKETFERIKFGGSTPRSQKVYYINLQEIKGQKFGTPNAVNYYDSFYNAELFLRCHGDYSIKITDPLKFFAEVVPRDARKVDFEDISEQYLAEFLQALQASINKMSADGERISFVTSKGMELSRYMQEALDADWKDKRGFEVESVGIASISYDEESQRLINMRNQGAMMSNAAIREGYLQSEIAQGIHAAGENTSGAGTAFMGMGMGMSTAGSFMGAASATNAQQMAAAYQAQQAPQQAAPAAGGWKCACGAVNTGNFCTNCGAAKPAPAAWQCSCGAMNTGNFCTNCGKPRA